MWVALHVVALAAAGPSGLGPGSGMWETEDPAAVGLSEAALLKAAAEVARVAPIRCMHVPPPAHLCCATAPGRFRIVATTSSLSRWWKIRVLTAGVCASSMVSPL
jgi:hypothetical protein